MTPNSVNVVICRNAVAPAVRRGRAVRLPIALAAPRTIRDAPAGTARTGSTENGR